MAGVIFLLTQMYIYSKKISPPRMNFFSGLPNFFNRQLIDSQKIREKVPCPLKKFVHTQNQSEMTGVFFVVVDTCIYQIRKNESTSKNTFFGRLIFLNRICDQPENNEKSNSMF